MALNVFKVLIKYSLSIIEIIYLQPVYIPDKHKDLSNMIQNVQ